MTKKNIISVDYFNVNDKKNSILENAKYQDNGINDSLNKIRDLTENIKGNISKNETKDNLDKTIVFKKQ